MTTSTSSTWHDQLAAREDEHRAELDELLRLPSVSTDPDRARDVAATAEWVAARLRRAGVPEVEVVATAGHPAVLGRWHGREAAPTVLIYGHYDVQPEEPVALWQSPPFEPTERDGRIYARGSSDMKGNLLTAVQGVEALAAAHGAPPVNVTFIFEGEEAGPPPCGAPGPPRRFFRGGPRLPPRGGGGGGRGPGCVGGAPGGPGGV